MASFQGLAQAGDGAADAAAAKSPTVVIQHTSSTWYTQLTKLAQSGVAEEVMISFVDSAGTFNLDADKILALRDHGVSDQVITTVLQHDSEIAQGLRIESPSTAPATTHLTFVKMVPEKPAAKPAAPATASDDSIIGTPANYDEDDLFVNPDDEENSASSPAAARVSPVREPYPVQLTQTIVMMPLALRTPNVHLLIPFP